MRPHEALSGAIVSAGRSTGPAAPSEMSAPCYLVARASSALREAGALARPVFGCLYIRTVMYIGEFFGKCECKIIVEILEVDALSQGLAAP